MVWFENNYTHDIVISSLEPERIIGTIFGLHFVIQKSKYYFGHLAIRKSNWCILETIVSSVECGYEKIVLNVRLIHHETTAEKVDFNPTSVFTDLPPICPVRTTG